MSASRVVSCELEELPESRKRTTLQRNRKEEGNRRREEEEETAKKKAVKSGNNNVCRWQCEDVLSLTHMTSVKKCSSVSCANLNSD